MALNQTNKLAWIVDTICRAKKISFEDLNRKWMDNTDLSGGEELLKRTFHKWRWSIYDTFGLVIECEKGGQYRYYIDNVNDLQNGSIESWLLSTFSVCNSLIESKSIKERILLEEVPSGKDYLESIISAMKEKRFIHIAHCKYTSSDTRNYQVMPLCVKLFKQRWYLVGRIWPSNKDVVFSLDRICNCRISDQDFEFPQEFNPQDFFSGCIGVITGTDCKIQRIRLKVSSRQTNYLRDLPLHESQQEIYCSETHSIFEFMLRPTFDFQQEILSNGEDVEVLEPLWLRKEIAGKIKRMWNQYNK